MKRLLALLMTVVFCVAVFSPMAAAICPDPNKPLPWDHGREARPQGDDGGWGEPNTKSDVSDGNSWTLLMNFRAQQLCAFLIIFHVDQQGQQDRDGNEHSQNTSNHSGPDSR